MVDHLTVRAHAAVALGRIGSPSARRALQNAVQNDKNIAIRRLAAKGLAIDASPESVPVLENAVRKDKSPHVQRQAYAALRAIGTKHGQVMTDLKEPAPPKPGKPQKIEPPDTGAKRGR